jgi:tRNA(adenine34) deaminase
MMTVQPASETQDEKWMAEALAEANRAQALGEVPVGAVVVFDGKIVGRGHNRVVQDSDPTAHAEVVALRAAAITLGNYRLSGCDLFVTIEPCAMCAGAIVHARVKSLAYGTDDPKAGAVRSVLGVLNHPQLNHKVEVRSGVLRERCARLLQEFFKKKRARS